MFSLKLAAPRPPQPGAQPSGTPANADYFSRAADWEAFRTAKIEQSERRAWWVAGGFFALALLSWISIILMMPLKQTTPYIVRVDNVTGAVEVVTVLNDERIGYDDAIDKYWLAQFVRARETYDWYTLQRDYDQTRMLAGPVVGKQYTDQFEGERALDKVYGKQYRATVEVLSVSPDGSGAATVRYVKNLARTDDPHARKQANFVATVGYEYRNPSRLTASERMVNPFGFQVMSYRTDEEFGTPPQAAPEEGGEGQ
jgi:type IV secretory pathway component VirB8